MDMRRLLTGIKGDSLHTRLVLTMVALVTLTLFAAAAIAYRSMDNEVAETIEHRTLTSLRVAVRIFAEGAPIFTVERNAAREPEVLRLTSPSTMLDNFAVGELNQIVDSISEANRGTATIFRWREAEKDYVRVATTVKKADGTRAAGTKLGQDGPVYPFMIRKQAFRGVAPILGEPYHTGYLPIVDQKDAPVGILYIGVGKVAELSAQKIEMVRDLLIACAVILAVAIAVTFFAARRLLAPLGRVAAATNALASGEENVAMPHRDRPDQIGIIARAVEGFSAAVTGQREAEQESIEEARRAAERKREMDDLVVQFRHSVKDCLEQLRTGSEKVRSTSGDIRDVVMDASARVIEGRNAADDGANAISDVATATNQFASSITEIAARSNDAASIVRHATEAGKNAESVASELQNAVEKIATAVAFISSIASQTNLLALNATIEAARAGEAGKGFAVVASEVKELSNGTSRAATEIVELVKSIEGVTQAVTGATREIGGGLESINETTLVIAAAVTEQEQVTRDIAANADSAAQRSDVIRTGFDAVQTAISNTAQAAGSLEALSEDFAKSSDRLVREIEDFLTRMAA